VYRLGVNEWNGAQSLQLIVEHWQPASRFPSRESDLTARTAFKRAASPALLYNPAFSSTPMEAEQLNAIARRLQDLSRRNAELRRYL